MYFNNKDVNILSAYSNADWVGDLNDRMSTSGYISMLSGRAVSWKSRKKTCVAVSTVEAEYVALANVAQEVNWMRQLMEILNASRVNQLLFMKIIKLQFALLRILSVTIKRNTLISNIIL